MKRILFLLMLCMVTTFYAQTNTWTGAGTDDNWNTVANWSLNAVPIATNDVIIPSGSTVIINVSSFVKSIVVQGTSTVTMNNSLSFTDASSFSANTTVNWNSNSFYGGGTLTNNGTVNLTTAGSRYISGATTLINNGEFIMPEAGYFYLYDTSVFNNTSSGIFDIQSDAIVSYSNVIHNFINAGTILKSGGDAVAYMSCIITNTGTISVQSGTLSMNGLAKTFNGGTYNVTSGNVLSIDILTNISGTLSGLLNGAINWNNNLSVASTGTFNFTGSTQVNWYGGSLIGGGTLTNSSTISLTGGGSRYISGGTTLTNTGMVNMPGAGYFYLYDTSVFDNTVSGTFDLQSDAVVSYSNVNHNFINAGTLEKTGGADIAYMSCIITNTGTIGVQRGTLSLNVLEKNFNGGTYNVTAGKVLSLDAQTNVSSTLTGALNGAFNWKGNISVASTATFNFSGSTQVNWYSGSLIGGGILTNTSTISLTGGGSRYVSGGTTLSNTGLVNIIGAGYFYLYDTSVFDNTASGTFDLQSDAVLSYSNVTHNFINAGTFQKTGGTDTAYMSCVMTNTGTISVQSGTLSMNVLAKTFNGGTYNVTSGNVLSLNVEINASGDLEGLLEGDLNWLNNISVASIATFDFTGVSGVNWYSGSLIGSGTLTNNGLLVLAGGGSRYISGTDTALVNTGTMNFPDGGYLYLYTDTVLDNQTSGVIDFQSDPVISYSGSGYNIINAGLIKKTAGTGVTYISPPVTNSGTIDVMIGELEFSDGFGLTNTIDGIIKGTATIDIPAGTYFTNEGTFAPGGSPGTLTALGTYKSSSTSVLDVELNGLTQNTEYDLLAITGTNAIFEGNVNVALGFDANVGDSFTIATVSGVIVTKNLVSPIYADFGCKHYTFDVTYPNDKNVLLTISSKEDIIAPDVVIQNITVQLNASGMATITPFQINNGSTDNCTIPANLTFALDVASFTCANLGENTVSLTVTDEAGNSASANAIVTVEDNVSPTINCPADFTVDSNGAYTLPNYVTGGQITASDNCAVTITQTPPSGTLLNDGIHVISFVATDGSGNSVNCNFNLDVNDTSLSVNDYELSDASILMFPNPATQNITLKNNSNVQLKSAVIIDVKGSVIQEINMEDMGVDKTIYIKDYASGVYFVKIISESTSIVKRLIKQ